MRLAVAGPAMSWLCGMRDMHSLLCGRAKLNSARNSPGMRDSEADGEGECKTFKSNTMKAFN